MRDAHPVERETGIEYYLSDTDGIGGSLRQSPDEFIVREIESISPEPLSADPVVYDHVVVRATLVDYETNAFVSALSDELGISRERISWAGTKDKRAVTTQLFTIEGVNVDDLPAVSGATIEPVGRFGRRLFFGDLAGNQFTITVRKPEHPEYATAITDELGAYARDPGVIGLPNYFGHQRFGSIRPVTHHVGLHIIRRNWKQAVLTYVGSPTDDEPSDTRCARAFVEETENWDEALQRMPVRMRYERAILHTLVATDREGDAAYRAALGALPRNLQQLFVHAAQSYLFNQIISERLTRSIPIHRAIDGDIVCMTDEINGVVVPDTDRLDHVPSNRVETVNRLTARRRAFVTAPLIGTDTTFASGRQGEIERDILATHDLEPSDFDLPDPFRSDGTRRPIMVTTDLTMEHTPLRFEFSLPRGSYATIVLREYLKTSPLVL